MADDDKTPTNNPRSPNLANPDDPRPEEDIDKLLAAENRAVDFIELIALRLEDDWQWIGDSSAILAFLVEKDSRAVLASLPEIRAEVGDLKPSEIAELIEHAARRAKEGLRTRGK